MRYRDERPRRIVWGGVLGSIAGALALILSVGGGPPPTSAQAEDVASRCNAEATQPAQISCFIDAAQAADNPGLCDAAEDAAVRFNCIALYAERSGNAAPCARIEVSDNETQALRDACISGVAAANRDPALCQAAILPVMRDACYMTLVVQFDADPALCAKIRNEKLLAACTEE